MDVFVPDEAYLRSVASGDVAYLRSVASGDVAPVAAEDVDFLRSVPEALLAGEEEDGLPPSREQAAMAARAEGPLASVAEDLEREAGRLRQGAAAFAADRALAAALLRKAAWVDALRAEVAATLGAARGMKEDYLGRIAGGQEGVLEPDEATEMQESSRHAAALVAEGPAAFAAVADKAAGAARIAAAAAELVVGEMAELARMIRAGAEVFRARPGEDRSSLVARLLSEAEAAERHGVLAQAVAADFRTFRFSLIAF